MDKKSNRLALFISVLLHSLLVFFPWKEKPRPLAESSPPENSIPIVDLSHLSTPPVSEAQPLPTVPSRPSAPAVSNSPPVATPVDLAPEAPITETSDSSIGEPAPEADLTPEVPIPETSDSPIDEAKIAADWENLAGYLGEQDDGFEFYDLLGIFRDFGEPEQVNQFFDENNQPKLDVSSFYLFPEQTPEQVLQTVVIPELTSNTDFDLQLQENVSAGLAYQLSQGEMLRYLIIVQLNERSGSVLMLSDSLQGLES